MYFRNPNMHDKYFRPTQDGQQLANNIVMLGAGLALLGSKSKALLFTHSSTLLKQPLFSAVGIIRFPPRFCMRASFHTSQTGAHPTGLEPHGVAALRYSFRYVY